MIKFKAKLTKTLKQVRGLSEGESSPGEFPWTCLILNQVGPFVKDLQYLTPLRMIMITLKVLMIHLAQNNDFLGTCALVPQSFNNDLGQGTRKVCVL